MTFERIYTHCIDKAPQLAPRNTYVIHEWIANGYDVERDIIPAIDAATKHGGKTIHSFAFFTGFIRTHNEKRIKAAIPKNTHSQAQMDELKAKQIAYAIRKAGKCLPTDERWLDSYEQKHGRVEA
jgi:hypothetical protein